jgi:hypothetical protein
MAHIGGAGPLSSRRAQQQETSVVESHFQGLLGDVMVDDDRYRALCGAFGYLQQQEWPDLSSACYAGFGAPVPGVAQETSNGGNSFSCSGSASSGGGNSRKRKPDAHADAKVKILCLRTVRACLCRAAVCALRRYLCTAAAVFD